MSRITNEVGLVECNDGRRHFVGAIQRRTGLMSNYKRMSDEVRTQLGSKRGREQYCKFQSVKATPVAGY